MPRRSSGVIRPGACSRSIRDAADNEIRKLFSEIVFKIRLLTRDDDATPYLTQMLNFRTGCELVLTGLIKAAAGVHVNKDRLVAIVSQWRSLKQEARLEAWKTEKAEEAEDAEFLRKMDLWMAAEPQVLEDEY